MPDTNRDEITKLQKEYEKQPEGRLFVHLAEAYRTSGESERALEILEEGLRHHEDYPSAWIVLAQVQTEMGRPQDARNSWERVLKLDGDNELALRALGELEFNDGRSEESLRHFRRLAELNAGDHEAREMIAMIEDADSARSSEEAGSSGPSEAAAEPAAELSGDQSGDAEERQAAPREDEANRRYRQSQQSSESSVPAGRREAPLDSSSGGGLSFAHTDAIGITDLLVRLLEYRESTFHAGSSLTRLLARSIGQELELERTHLEALALAALLSDLGGLSLSDPRSGVKSRGGESERQREQREVAVSLQLLQEITLPAGVHEAIRHQHERWDGSGYPDGLRDEEIPYGARVIAIARACAEMLTQRNGTAPRSVASALDELQRNAGSRYDPVIVSVLRRVFQRRADHGVGFGVGGRIAIVHPEELRSLGLATRLHSHGYVCEMTSETGRIRERLRGAQAKALVIGADIAGVDVARLIQEVRSSQNAASIPILAIDANKVERRIDLLTAGADVCFASDVGFDEFRATLDALLRRTEDRGITGESGGRGAVEVSG